MTLDDVKKAMRKAIDIRIACGTVRLDDSGEPLHPQVFPFAPEDVRAVHPDKVNDNAPVFELHDGKRIDCFGDEVHNCRLDNGPQPISRALVVALASLRTTTDFGDSGFSPCSTGVENGGLYRRPSVVDGSDVGRRIQPLKSRNDVCTIADMNRNITNRKIITDRMQMAVDDIKIDLRKLSSDHHLHQESEFVAACLQLAAEHYVMTCGVDDALRFVAIAVRLAAGGEPH